MAFFSGLYDPHSATKSDRVVCHARRCSEHFALHMRLPLQAQGGLSPSFKDARRHRVSHARAARVWRVRVHSRRRVQATKGLGVGCGRPSKYLCLGSGLGTSGVRARACWSSPSVPGQGSRITQPFLATFVELPKSPFAAPGPSSANDAYSRHIASRTRPVSAWQRTANSPTQPRKDLLYHSSMFHCWSCCSLSRSYGSSGLSCVQRGQHRQPRWPETLRVGRT